MKFLHILSLLLVTLLAYTSAQQCPPNPVCTGPRNEGRACRPRGAFYYNAQTRQCVQMRYLGCGGNNNRWCTRAACEQRCRRRGG